MHYINYGTAKTASTWLFSALKLQGTKEPPLELVESKDAYLNYFKKQSVNFNPNLWQLDSGQIDFLNSVATHQSIIFRDPYTYADSLYNFWGAKSVAENFVVDFKQYFDYSEILKRLPKRTLVLYHHNIKDNPQTVLNKLTNFLELPPVVAPIGYINKTNYKHHLNFSKEDVIMLNDFIKKFEDYVQEDLGHWKKNV